MLTTTWWKPPTDFPYNGCAKNSNEYQVTCWQWSFVSKWSAVLIHSEAIAQKVFYKTGLRSATLLKKRPCHWRFPVNFAKFLRTPFFKEHLRSLLLSIYVPVFKDELQSPYPISGQCFEGDKMGTLARNGLSLPYSLVKLEIGRI